MKHVYKTKHTCSTQISFELENDVVRNIAFANGCSGNLRALSKVLDGWTVGQIEDKLRGNICGSKPTSCADQLAIAVREAYEEEHNTHR